jgi:hypothetical protein
MFLIYLHTRVYKCSFIGSLVVKWKALIQILVSILLYSSIQKSQCTKFEDPAFDGVCMAAIWILSSRLEDIISQYLVLFLCGLENDYIGNMIR